MITNDFNDEVTYARDRIVKISQKEIAYLKQRAHANRSNKFRVCTHGHVENDLHEMFIVHTKDVYVRPHKHLNKPESFHIIEGAVDIVIFDDQGSICDVIEMGEPTSDKIFYYRLTGPWFHTLIIHSDDLVFHETTKGPFKMEDTIFAEWSPGVDDSDGIKKYNIELLQDVNRFQENKSDDG